MEPEVFDHVAAGESVDWSGDVFPQLLEKGAADLRLRRRGLLGGRRHPRSPTCRRRPTCSTGKVDVDIDGFEISPGVWVAEGADVAPAGDPQGPAVRRRLRQGRGRGRAARVHRARQQRRREGRRVPAPRRRARQRVHRAADQPAWLRDRQEHRRDARRPPRGGRGHRRRVRHRGGGDRRQPASRSTRSRTSRPARSSTPTVIWESRGQRSAVRAARRVSGIVNVEITPELVVRLASAYASTLKKGSTVTTSRDVSRAARALKRAVIAALTSSAIDVRRPRGRARAGGPPARPRRATPRAASSIRTTPGQPESVDIVFLDRARRRPVAGRPAQARAHLLPRRSSAARSPARSATCCSRPG